MGDYILATLISIGDAASILGVCIETLRRWDASGYLLPVFRTAGGHRRYSLIELKNLVKTKQKNTDKTLCYARVSSHDQQKDLETQALALEQYCKDNNYAYEVIKDLGSGLNFKKKGLKKLLSLIYHRQINRLVLNHKDRLLRVGSQLVFNLCELCDVEVVILENGPVPDLQTALVTDVIELMTVFSARLYGSRSHKNKNKLKISN